MRWVWRGETGAFKLEYAVLLLLVATVTTAVIAAGIPARVMAGIDSAVCAVFDEDCDPPGDAGADSGGTGTDAATDGPGSVAGSPAPPTPSDGDTEAAKSGFDWEELDARYSDYEEAQREHWQAQAELEEAEGDFAELDGELVDLLSEIIGLADAERCLTEGDIAGCIWTAINVVPVGKLFKVGNKIPKMWKLFDRWTTVRRARNSAKTAVKNTSGRLSKAAKACASANSFPAGTPVLLADGTTTPIEDIEVGDHVLARDPLLGLQRPQPVTDTITGTGPKDMVDITLGAGHGTVTATAGHPFWNEAERTWVPAADLAAGDRIAPANGARTVPVRDVHEYAEHRRVHNLTVARFHTYYVATGSTNVLVHNANKKCPTKTQRISEHLSDKDLEAAKRELDGEVVARRPDGTPYDHVTEVREAQNGLLNRIEQIKNRLDYTGTTKAEREALEEELSEASKLLDKSEEYVPRNQ